jgi:hypothetical protein
VDGQPAIALAYGSSVCLDDSLPAFKDRQPTR